MKRYRPEAFYKIGFAAAGILTIPIYWLISDTAASKSKSSSSKQRNNRPKQSTLSLSPTKLLRSRSADGVINTETTRHDKLKLLILRLLKSPNTKSSIAALEMLDRSLVEIANEFCSESGLKTHVVYFDAWREELRQLVLLGLQRGTQMQSFDTVSRLLSIYDGISVKQPYDGISNPISKNDNKVLKKARNLIRSRMSTQWKQMHVLVKICGKTAFVWLILGAGIGITEGWMSQLQIHYLGMIMNAALEGNTAKASTAFLATVAAQLVSNLLEQLGSECVARGGKTIRRSVQGQLFERLMRAGCSFHDHLPGGAKAALLKETSDLESDLFQKPIEICKMIGQIVPMYSLMTHMSMPLLLMSCIASPFLGWISGRAAIRTASVRRAMNHLESARNITDQMVLGSHLKTVRAYTDENHEIDRYNAYLSHHHTLEREELKAKSWSEGARFFKQCSSFCMIVLLARMVSLGTLAKDQFTTTYYELHIGWGNVEELYKLCGSFFQSFEPAGRVLAALSLHGEEEKNGKEQKEEKKEEKKVKSISTSSIKTIKTMETIENNVVGIEFKDVWFSYPLRSNNPVLRGISFSVPPGSATAIVGASGSGKSTIMALIEGFYNAQNGQILFGEVDTDTMSIQERRRKTSYVSQDARIFPRSVRDNVLMGGRHLYNVDNDENSDNDENNDYDANAKFKDVDSDVVHALKQANAWEFCERLPNGLHTWVVSGGGSGGPDGDTFNSILNLSRDNKTDGNDTNDLEGEAGADTMGLSGGQSARISIARAILRRAPILLLDEAFSNLDAKSERTILDELRKMLMKEKRTVIAISHQLDSLDWVDQVVVVKDGVVVEKGTYDDLKSRKGGHFYKMIRQKRCSADVL